MLRHRISRSNRHLRGLHGRQVMRELIGSDAPIERLRDHHRSLGGTMLMDEGIHLAETGRTSLDEVVEAAYSD